MKNHLVSFKLNRSKEISKKSRSYRNTPCEKTETHTYKKNSPEELDFIHILIIIITIRSAFANI